MTSTPRAQQLLEAALAYATKRGWHVFPCHTPTAEGCSCLKRASCQDVGKHPRTENGLKDATTDEATIRRWWKMWPDANVAIRTGAISGLVALDVDVPKGGDDSLAALEQTYSALPDTAMQLTGTGLHYLFAHPGRSIKNGVEDFAAGLDIRGDGGYIIAAPSLHENGKQYCWEVLHEPDDTALAPMPAWLLALCQEPARRETVRAGNAICDGRRNVTLFTLGCSFRAKGCSEAIILAALQAMNATQCQPPLTEKEVEKIAASAAKYEAGAGPDPTAAPAADLQDTRPVIRLGPDITRMVDEGQAALLALPHGPVLFQRARRLSLIARGVKPPQWLHRPADAPVIIEAQAAYLDELATQAARWEKFDKRAKKGEEWIEVTPPSRFVQTLQARPSWPFPLLEGLIHSPTLRPDGSLLATPGYDAATGLFFDSNGTTFPSLRMHPTLDDARSALGRLQEAFQDFPFAAREENARKNPYFSATIAAVLTLVGRPAIQGNISLFGVTATAAGSGKGKLVDVISIIGTGRSASKMGQTLDDNEELKRLLALALEGTSPCCIDNVTHPFGNQYLDMALTTQAITGRILGQTQLTEAPWNAVLFATGNNLAYRGDMTRRVVPIALDPKMEKPEERANFRHPALEAWVTTERPQLVAAALTILRAYFVADCPAQGLTPYGSFEAWSDLMRNALVWVGEADPCEGRQDLAAQTDEAYERLASLLTAWERCYPLKDAPASPAKTFKTIKQDIALYAANKDQVPNTWDDFRTALSEFDKRYDGKTLNTHLIGNALRTVEGRVIDQRRLKRCGLEHKQSLWRI
jgi:putative DNA primase/helicase